MDMEYLAKARMERLHQEARSLGLRRVERRPSRSPSWLYRPLALRKAAVR